jgi:transposase
MVEIGRDVSERLMVEPSKFWVERIIRPIYKTIVQEKEEEDALFQNIIQATPVAAILPGCMVGEPLLSQIIVDKFLYHIPEYRQAVRFKALGVEITTSSINRWVHAVADKLYPLYIAQMEKVLSTDYMQVDETTLPVVDRPGSARKAYVWAVRSASGLYGPCSAVSLKMR